MKIQLALLLSAISIFLLPVDSYRTAPVSIVHYRRRLDKYRHYRTDGIIRHRVVRGPKYFGHTNFYRKHQIGRKVMPVGYRGGHTLISNPWYVSRISKQISRLPYIPPLRCAKNRILACSEYKRGDFKRKCFGKCFGKPCIKTCGCACLHRKDFLPKRIHIKSSLLPINRQSLIPFCRSRQVLRCTPKSFHLSVSKVRCSHACSEGVCPTSCKCQCIAERHVGVGLKGDVMVVGHGNAGVGVSTAGVNGISFAGEMGLSSGGIGGGGLVGIGGNINGMLQDMGINSLDLSSLDGLGLGGLDTGGIDLNGFNVGSAAVGIGSDGFNVGSAAVGIGSDGFNVGSAAIGIGSDGIGLGSLDAPDLSLPSLDVPDLGVPSLDSAGLGLDEVLDFPSLDNGVGAALADGFVGVGNGVIGLAGAGGAGHAAGGKRKGSGKKEITETVDVKINVTTNGNKKGKSKGGKHSGGAGSGMGFDVHGLLGGPGGHSGFFPGADHGFDPHAGQAPGTFPNGRKVGVIAGGNNGGVNDPIFISDPTQPKQFPKEPVPLIPGSGTSAVGLNQGAGSIGGPADTLLNIPDLGADLAALNGVDALGGIPLNAQGKGPALPDLQFGAGSDPGMGMAGGFDLATGGGVGAPADIGLGHDFGGAGGAGGGHSAPLNDAACSQTGEKLWCDVNSKWGNTPGLLQWCNTNCPSGSCDHERCSCYCVPPSVYDSNLVQITAFK